MGRKLMGRSVSGLAQRVGLLGQRAMANDHSAPADDCARVCSVRVQHFIRSSAGVQSCFPWGEPLSGAFSHLGAITCPGYADGG